LLQILQFEPGEVDEATAAWWAGSWECAVTFAGTWWWVDW